MRHLFVILAIVLAGVAGLSVTPGLTGTTATVRAAEPRTSVPGGLCSLWTVKQVSSAMKERMEVVSSDPDRCVWYGEPSDAGSISTATAGLWAGDPSSSDTFIDQARVSGPKWAGEAEVAGIPVLRTAVVRAGKAREISVDAFPDAVTWMTLRARSERGKNVQAALGRLIEIAVPKLAPAASAPASPGASASMGPGSSATPIEPCSLLTEDEVSAALGEPVTAAAAGAEACLYQGDVAAGSRTAATVVLVRGEMAAGIVSQAQALEPAEVDIGGVAGLQTPPEALDTGWVRSQLVVMPDPDTALVVSVDAPEGVDSAATARGLAGLALPRLGAPPAPSTAPGTPAPSGPAPSGPAPSVATLTGLAALFPAQVGGSPVTVDVLTGKQFLSQVVGFKPMEDRVTKALRQRDRKIGDLSFAQAQTSNGSAILAFQVKGGRAQQLTAVLLESLGMERTGDTPSPDQVAGKEGVFGILSGAQGYGYARDEVLWLVFSFGSEELEIFQQLP